MLLSFATVTEVESQEDGGFWLETEIVVPEGISAVELVLDAFGFDAKSPPLSNLFAGNHNLIVEGGGPSPVVVGDTIPAQCFSEEEVRELKGDH